MGKAIQNSLKVQFHGEKDERLRRTFATSVRDERLGGAPRACEKGGYSIVILEPVPVLICYFGASANLLI